MVGPIVAPCLSPRAPCPYPNPLPPSFETSLTEAFPYFLICFVQKRKLLVYCIINRRRKLNKQMYASQISVDWNIYNFHALCRSVKIIYPWGEVVSNLAHRAALSSLQAWLVINTRYRDSIAQAAVFQFIMLCCCIRFKTRPWLFTLEIR